jgi:hypothetical protein
LFEGSIMIPNLSTFHRAVEGFFCTTVCLQWERSNLIWFYTTSWKVLFLELSSYRVTKISVLREVPVGSVAFVRPTCTQCIVSHSPILAVYQIQ